MTISLPEEKKCRIISLATRFLDGNGLTANELRSFLGVLESVRPVVEIVPLYFCSLQCMLRPLRKGPWRGHKVPHQSKGDTCGTTGSQEHDETGGTCPPVPGKPDGCILSPSSTGWGVPGPGHSVWKPFNFGRQYWTDKDG